MKDSRAHQRTLDFRLNQQRLSLRLSFFIMLTPWNVSWCSTGQLLESFNRTPSRDPSKTSEVLNQVHRELNSKTDQASQRLRSSILAREAKPNSDSEQTQDSNSLSQASSNQGVLSKKESRPKRTEATNSMTSDSVSGASEVHFGVSRGDPHHDSSK